MDMILLQIHYNEAEAVRARSSGRYPNGRLRAMQLQKYDQHAVAPVNRS